MDAVAVGRIVLAFVWVGQVFYFLFGVRTLPDDEEKNRQMTQKPEDARPPASVKICMIVFTPTPGPR